MRVVSQEVKVQKLRIPSLKARSSACHSDERLFGPSFKLYCSSLHIEIVTESQYICQKNTNNVSFTK